MSNIANKAAYNVAAVVVFSVFPACPIATLVSNWFEEAEVCLGYYKLVNILHIFQCVCLSYAPYKSV